MTFMLMAEELHRGTADTRCVVSRRNQLWDIFLQTCLLAGVSASIEAGSG